MKDYREKEMKYLLIVYILLLLLWCTNFIENDSVALNILNKLQSMFEVLAISGILSLSIFILDSLITSQLKDKLVGLFFMRKP